MHPKRILVSASGTGGHLMPALHVMKALKNLGAEVSFVGSGRPLEKEIIGSAGFDCYAVPIHGIKNSGLRGVLRFFLEVPKAFLAIRKIYIKTQPQAVLGVGGYATFFPIAYGRLTGVVSWIHEAELSPGLANKVLSVIAQHISLAFKETDFPFFKKKTIYTGQPIRQELVSIAGQSKNVSHPNRLLVLGGSQGASALDDAMLEFAPYLKKNKVQVWHQCRQVSKEKLSERYDELEIHHKIVTFIDEIDEAYRWSHVILSRAGAGAVMEIGLVNRPAIFVPYPHAQGDHQSKNAELLVSHGKAYLVKEGDDFHARLESSFEKVFNPEQYNKMRLRAGESRPTDAADRIAKKLLELIQ